MKYTEVEIEVLREIAAVMVASNAALEKED
jgi:hypothetical protein